MSIHRLLHEGLIQAIKVVLPDLETAEVTISFNADPRVRLNGCGQWQSSSLLKIAARLKINALKLAQDTCLVLQQAQHHYLQECFVTGRGFLNFNLHDAFLKTQVQIAARPKQKGHILIDFGGANIAKPLHVGHMRSLLIGEALRRVYVHCGFSVLSDIHLGDWGAQIGIVITGIATERPDLPFFQDQLPHYPEQCPLPMPELLRLYQDYKHSCATDASLYQQAQRYIKIIQTHGHPGIMALWRAILTLSKQYIHSITDYLGAHFDLWHGESDVRDLIPEMLQAGLQTGVITRDQGALVIKLSDTVNMLVQKTDGCALYSTTDLATLKYRVSILGVTEIIYVVDKRQSLHFQHLFQGAQLLQLTGTTKLSYVGFGTVNDAHHKPFKTRAGHPALLTTIMAQTIQAFRQQEQRAELLESHATTLALNAIKFSMLATAHDADYRFDFAKFTQSEGKTGVYIVYTAVRIKKLQQLHPAAHPPSMLEAQFSSPFPEDVRNILLQLSQLEDVLDETMLRNDPVYLTLYLYDLCRLVNHFYATTSIIKEPDAAKRKSYERLCTVVLTHLELVSYLLGLSLPESL